MIHAPWLDAPTEEGDWLHFLSASSTVVRRERIIDVDGKWFFRRLDAADPNFYALEEGGKFSKIYEVKS